MKTLFLAEWVEAVFMHFRIAPARLQPLIPLELDLLDGDVYVTLVAFTQQRLRPCIGGPIACALATPLTRHEFFNVRTYVRAGGARGIFFLTEWIPNRLAALIGPRMYGLPYRLGRLRYQNDWRERALYGRIVAAHGRVVYRATLHTPDFAPAKAGTRDDFLLERYVAFTHRNGIVRRFDVQHEPWPQAPAHVELLDATLLPQSGEWFDHAELIGGNYSPGVRDVAISPPRLVAMLPPPSPSRSPSASPFRSAGPPRCSRSL